jgi:acyl carrier protein
MLLEADVIARVRTFIQDNFLYMRPGLVLADHDRFVERQVLDSMGVMELVAFLRDEFGIKVPEKDVLDSNLGSLADIGRYVTSQAPRAGG